MKSMPQSGLIQSLLRGLSILELAADESAGLRLQDISEALDVGASTAHNLARTLESRGYLRKLPRPTRYVLGPAVGDLARRHVPSAMLRHAEGVLGELSAKLPFATISLAMPLGGEVMSVARISPERRGVFERPIARAMHPYGTASALLFQAFWPAEERLEYQSRYPFWEWAAHLWSTKLNLSEFLSISRENGYVDLEMENSDSYLVAFPVLTAGEEISAALGVRMSLELTDVPTRHQCLYTIRDAAETLAAGDSAGRPQSLES